MSYQGNRRKPELRRFGLVQNKSLYKVGCNTQLCSPQCSFGSRLVPLSTTITDRKEKQIEHSQTDIRSHDAVSTTGANTSFPLSRWGRDCLSSLVHAVLLSSARLLADRGAVQLCRVLPPCGHDRLRPVSNTGLAGALPVAEAGLQEEAFVAAV